MVTVNGDMGYSYLPRHQRSPRYQALAQYEGDYLPHADTAEFGTGNGPAGYARPPGAPARPASWDDEPWPASTADAGTFRSGTFDDTFHDGTFGAADDAADVYPVAPPTGRRQRGRGLLAGGIAGFLAAAVALGVANLAAAFVRPQASPVIAVGGAFIDRTPPALKNFAVEKFGENDKNVLLLGMYVTIALIAIAIGMLAWRRPWIGETGIGLFGAFGALVALTRPASHVTDVLPSIAGGIVGIAAMAWLVRAGTRRPGYRSPGRGTPGYESPAHRTGWMT